MAVSMTPQQVKRWLEIRQQTDLLHEIAPERLDADLAEQYDADLQLSAAVTLLRLQQLDRQANEQAAAH